MLAVILRRARAADGPEIEGFGFEELQPLIGRSGTPR